MRLISSVNKLCLCCMEKHEVSFVEVEETNVFKGEKIKYKARYEYCDKADEYYSSEDMIEYNDVSMKDEYRRKKRLLTYIEIINIRKKYSISQKDLSNLLGWGEKTITRYEGHQVQDMAHDAVLRKISSDPEWFLELLEQGKDKISETAYEKYKNEISKEYEAVKDNYLRKAIKSEYIKYEGKEEFNGNRSLDFDKIVDVVCYFADSDKVSNLFKVKLMKLLWYADFLSFKRYGHSITGMVYTIMPMGAVPVGHKSIIDLKGISYEEIEYENGSGYKFLKSEGSNYDALSEEDISVLDTVIKELGDYTKEQIVERMHSEDAYVNTGRGNVINYSYAMNLGLD